MALTIDWIAIKSEYINTNISQRDLAKKHDVSISTLTKRANKEKWQQQKETQCNNIEAKLQQKTQDVIVDREVNRVERIVNVTDNLILKIEQATEQLDNYIVTNKKKVKTVEYDDKAKPTKEVTTEIEELEIVDGIINAKNLKNIASALKDIKDILAVVNPQSDHKEPSELFNALEKEDEE